MAVNNFIEITCIDEMCTNNDIENTTEIEPEDDIIQSDEIYLQQPLQLLQSLQSLQSPFEPELEPELEPESELKAKEINPFDNSFLKKISGGDAISFRDYKENQHLYSSLEDYIRIKLKQ